jgi:hypothetical protein
MPPFLLSGELPGSIMTQNTYPTDHPFPAGGADGSMSKILVKEAILEVCSASVVV